MLLAIEEDEDEEGEEDSEEGDSDEGNILFYLALVCKGILLLMIRTIYASLKTASLTTA